MPNQVRILRNFGIMFAVLALYLAFMIPGYRDPGLRQVASYMAIAFAATSVISFVAALVLRRRK